MTHQIAREICIKVTNTDVESLKPIKPFQKPRHAKTRFTIQKFEQGLMLEKEHKAAFKPKWQLPHYMMKDSLRRILHQSKSDLDEESIKNFREILGSPLSLSNYSKRFEILLHCEEFQMEQDIKNYDMQGVTMQVVHHCGQKKLKLDVPGKTFIHSFSEHIAKRFIFNKRLTFKQIMSCRKLKIG